MKSLALLVLALAAAVLAAPRNASSEVVDGFEIIFLDVGQGDGILVTANGERLLIDGGPRRSTLRTRLHSLGVSDIDAIAISNPDADHIRGLIEALAIFDVERVYTSGSTHTTQAYADLVSAIAAEPGIQVVTLGRGATIPLGELRVNVLHPAMLTGDRNADSLTLQIACNMVNVLLMGDATAASEQSMLDAGVITNADVLKAGHHGSDTSSSLAFLRVADPEVVVFSAGLGSRYRHPHPAVVARVRSIGASTLRTDTTSGDDSIIMTSDCETYEFSAVSGG